MAGYRYRLRSRIVPYRVKSDKQPPKAGVRDKGRSPSTPRANSTVPSPVPARNKAKKLPEQCRPCKIAAFNIRIFGDKKYDNVHVRQYIIKILGRYDITLVQEIRDKDGDSFNRLMEDLNKQYDDQYEHRISVRLGRGPQKEQYAFIFRTADFMVLDTYQYTDRRDKFERPPYVVKFYSKSCVMRNFAIIGVHIKPTTAEVEIDALIKVYDLVCRRWDTKEVLIMGDLNSDCSYVTKAEMKRLRLRHDPRFTWLIDDDYDTTVSSGTTCAYDRFIAAGDQFPKHIDHSSVKAFRFDSYFKLSEDKANDISDHYPIEFVLR